MQCTKTHAYAQRDRDRERKTVRILITWMLHGALLTHDLVGKINYVMHHPYAQQQTGCNHLINKPFMNFIMELRTICIQCIPLWRNDIKSINISFVLFFLFGSEGNLVHLSMKAFEYVANAYEWFPLANKWRICKISVSVTFTTSLLLLIGWIEAWWNRVQYKPT